MKAFRWMGLLGLALMLGAGHLWALGSFEGEIDMQMTTSSGKVLPVQYFVKGEKVRMNMQSQDNKYTGSSIMDMKTFEIIVVMDKQKMYMVSQVHPEKLQAHNNDKHFKIQDSGNSQTILGHTCEEWDWTSDDGSGKMWFAKGIGNWWANMILAQKNMPSDQKAIAQMVVNQKMFPLKYEMSDKSGKVTHTMDVTKITPRSLGAAMFTPPAGYKKLDMGNLFNGGNQSTDSNNPSGQDPLSGVKPKLPF